MNTRNLLVISFWCMVTTLSIGQESPAAFPFEANRVYGYYYDNTSREYLYSRVEYGLYLSDGRFEIDEERTRENVRVAELGSNGSETAATLEGFVSVRSTAWAFAEQHGWGSLFVAEKAGTRYRLLALGSFPPLPQTRMANISTRGLVQDATPLTAGFVVTGPAPRTYLIRAVGPTLSQFGVSAFLPNPSLRVMLEGSVVAQNDDWGVGQFSNAALLTSASTTLGAFQLIAGSRDAAVLVTLPPGAYTVQVSGGSGEALVEVYEY